MQNHENCCLGQKWGHGATKNHEITKSQNHKLFIAVAWKALKRSYYRRMVKYHSDKFNGPQHCATMMALILNAGKELLDSHSACANEREL